MNEAVHQRLSDSGLQVFAHQIVTSLGIHDVPDVRMLHFEDIWAAGLKPVQMRRLWELIENEQHMACIGDMQPVTPPISTQEAESPEVPVLMPRAGASVPTGASPCARPQRSGSPEVVLPLAHAGPSQRDATPRARIQQSESPEVPVPLAHAGAPQRDAPKEPESTSQQMHRIQYTCEERPMRFNDSTNAVPLELGVKKALSWAFRKWIARENVDVGFRTGAKRKRTECPNTYFFTGRCLAHLGCREGSGKRYRFTWQQQDDGWTLSVASNGDLDGRPWKHFSNSRCKLFSGRNFDFNDISKHQCAQAR